MRVCVPRDKDRRNAKTAEPESLQPCNDTFMALHEHATNYFADTAERFQQDSVCHFAFRASGRRSYQISRLPRS